jgi:hypothetical protein
MELEINVLAALFTLLPPPRPAHTRNLQSVLQPALLDDLSDMDTLDFCFSFFSSPYFLFISLITTLNALYLNLVFFVR